LTNTQDALVKLWL